MFIFKKVNEIIKMQDMNGTAIGFNFFRNSNNHKSWCGGLLSIVSVIGAIYFGSTKFFQMIYLDNTANGNIVQEMDPRGL